MQLLVLVRSALRTRIAVPYLVRSFSSSMPRKDKYSDPKLRDEIKDELMQSDKGGKPGQWSARKVCRPPDCEVEKR